MQGKYEGASKQQRQKALHKPQSLNTQNELIQRTGPEKENRPPRVRKSHRRAGIQEEKAHRGKN